MKLIKCLAVAIIGVSLAGTPPFNKMNSQAITVIGWTVALLVAKGGK